VDERRSVVREEREVSDLLPAYERRCCDDQFEFDFALDLLLDGLERLRQRPSASSDRTPPTDLDGEKVAEAEEVVGVARVEDS
jgi:hypothetical protein